MTTTTISLTRRLHYAWIILIMGVFVVFGALGLARFGYSVILPSMQADLGMSNTQAGALATANLVGYVLFSATGGALAARYGPRVVITVGLLLAGIGMLLTGLSDGFLTAAIWRALTGIGSGASNVPVMGLMAAWFAARRRGLASGIAVGGSSVGLILAGPLVPRLLSAYGDAGWRVSWYLFGGITLTLALISFVFLRNRPAEVGLPSLGDNPVNGDAAPASNQKPALEWGRVYRSAAVWHLGLVYLTFGFTYIIYLTFFTKSLIAEGGYSKEAAGSLFMTMGWFSLLSGVIWGMISDRVGRKRAMIVAYLILAVACIFFGLSRASPGFVVSAIVFGLAAWSLPAIMAATCGDVLGPALAPAALGFITLFFGLGQALGPSLAGALADATGTFAQAYVLAGVVAVLGAGGASLLRPASTARREA